MFDFQDLYLKDYDLDVLQKLYITKSDLIDIVITYYKTCVGFTVSNILQKKTEGKFEVFNNFINKIMYIENFEEYKQRSIALCLEKDLINLYDKKLIYIDSYCPCDNKMTLGHLITLIVDGFDFNNLFNILNYTMFIESYDSILKDLYYLNFMTFQDINDYLNI